MPRKVVLSLIVPTRARVDKLHRLLRSLVAASAQPEQIEIVLVVDEDDASMSDFAYQGLNVVTVTVPPGKTMGALNAAGYEASSGRYVMLLNDDVVVHTKNWDKTVLKVFKRFCDDIALIHVNDTVFQEKLCVFPLVSRRFCQLAGGICPSDYLRYRIDDHIEDIFTLLWQLGHKRIVYLPDVVFEHQNYVEAVPGLRQYFSDDSILAQDAPRFHALRVQREKIALDLQQHIDGRRYAPTEGQLFPPMDPTSTLRDPQRLIIRRSMLGRVRSVQQTATDWVRRIVVCFRSRGFGGLLNAVGRRVLPPSMRTDGF